MATNNAANGFNKITTYTSSDTWNKDPRTKFVTVWGWNSGAGGASGRKGSTAAAGGGGGGPGGGGFYYTGPADVFGNSETVTIGATVTGASAQSTDATNGINGSAANSSSFGNMTLPASGIALGGTTTSAGSGSSTSYVNFVSLTSMGTGGTGRQNAADAGTAMGTSSNRFMCGTGGGGGGGYDNAINRVGGAGGAFLKADASTVITAGGIAGNEGTTINGGTGNIPTTSGGILMGGTGGGGGGGPTVGTTAGNGGNGAVPGGGGGGGSGGITAVANSGAGGNGARGQITVIEFF